MTNNIGYKASIDVDWVRFKEQSGVEISDSGKTLETKDVIPSNLKLIVSKNSGDTRYATITFTQEGGETRQIKLSQNASKAGKHHGELYFNKDKSSLVIENTSGITDLEISGGTVNFTATYKKVYSTNWYQTDDDGNEISEWVEDNSASGEDVTSSSTCTWTVSPAINDSKINYGVLTVGENPSNGSPIFNVNATYKDSSGNTFTSNTLTVNQKPAPVAWSYTVKTNNPDTTVYFLSGDTEVHHDVAVKDDKLKDDAYYSTYSLPDKSVEKPNISAYIVKENVYISSGINFYEDGTEDGTENSTGIPKENSWNAPSVDANTELDAAYKVTKTTYKVENDLSNPKPLVDGEVNTIESKVDKTEYIIKRPNKIVSDSSWLSIKLAGDVTGDVDTYFTYSISAENNTTDSVRDGIIDFKYTDNEMPSAETKFTVSQNFLNLAKFVVTPSAITANWYDTSNSGVSITSTKRDGTYCPYGSEITEGNIEVDNSNSESPVVKFNEPNLTTNELNSKIEFTQTEGDKLSGTLMVKQKAFDGYIFKFLLKKHNDDNNAYDFIGKGPNYNADCLVDDPEYHEFIVAYDINHKAESDDSILVGGNIHYASENIYEAKSIIELYGCRGKENDKYSFEKLEMSLENLSTDEGGGSTNVRKENDDWILEALNINGKDGFKGSFTYAGKNFKIIFKSYNG